MEQVTYSPQTSISDAYAEGRACAVCGRAALVVVHLDGLPDYVKCNSCEAAFVLGHDEDWAMYGAIPEGFHATRAMALKKWQLISSIASAATPERGSPNQPVIEMEPPVDDHPTPAFGIEKPRSSAMPAESEPAPVPPELAPTPPFGMGQLEDFTEDEIDIGLIEEQTEQEAEQPEESAETSAVDALPDPSMEGVEPEPGRRSKTTLNIQYPEYARGRCAHCLNTPAKKKLQVSDESSTYEIPVCITCDRQAHARSEEESNARVVAHLSGAVIGAILTVATLAIGITSIPGSTLIVGSFAALLGLLAYGGATSYFLQRANAMPPPEDAQYIHSTVLIDHDDVTDHTTFSWRNAAYAELFADRNREAMVGEIERVYDQDFVARP